jgi:hypothetical protein
MIIAPQTQEQWNILMAFLNKRALVQPTMDMRMMGWVVNNDIKLVVGFNAFMGKVCQMHVAMAEDWFFTPKKMLQASFRYAFIECKCEMVLGIVNSRNTEAMKYDKHLGFHKLWSLPGMHDDGGDIVVLGMKKDECRYLRLIEEADDVAA